MAKTQKEKKGTLCIVEQGGFQYTVAEGDTIHVPRVEADEGAEIALDRVLLVRESGDVKVGTPVVDGAEVHAKVVEHGKDKKVLVIKKKKRKDYKRKNGHRQEFTRLEITAVKA